MNRSCFSCFTKFQCNTPPINASDHWSLSLLLSRYFGWPYFPCTNTSQPPYLPNFSLEKQKGRRGSSLADFPSHLMERWQSLKMRRGGFLVWDFLRRRYVREGRLKEKANGAPRKRASSSFNTKCLSRVPGPPVLELSSSHQLDSFLWTHLSHKSCTSYALANFDPILPISSFLDGS